MYTVVATATAITPIEMKNVKRSRRRRRLARAKVFLSET